MGYPQFFHFWNGKEGILQWGIINALEAIIQKKTEPLARSPSETICRITKKNPKALHSSDGSSFNSSSPTKKSYHTKQNSQNPTSQFSEPQMARLPIINNTRKIRTQQKLDKTNKVNKTQQKISQDWNNNPTGQGFRKRKTTLETMSSLRARWVRQCLQL